MIKIIEAFLALGLLMQSRTAKELPSIIPATPKGILSLLKYYRIPIKGQHVVIINDSYLVGRPLAHLVSAMGGTATICNRHTPDLSRHVSQQTSSSPPPATNTSSNQKTSPTPQPSST